MFTKQTNVLVVAAHPDDELLGLGGTLLKAKAAGAKLSILLLSNGEDSRGAAIADAGRRKKEAEAVAKELSADLFFEDFPDNAFDSVPLLSIAKAVEAVTRKILPDTVFTHHPYDLNIDHRRAAEAVLVASRPMPGAPVKRVFAFETPSSTEWQVRDRAQAFVPTAYVDIAEQLEAKLELLSHYAGELRPHPHPRSLEGVRTLAHFRGMEAGLRAAEAFETLRIID